MGRRAGRTLGATFRNFSFTTRHAAWCGMGGAFCLTHSPKEISWRTALNACLSTSEFGHRQYS